MPHSDATDHDESSLPDARVADRRDAIYTVLANKHHRAVLTCFAHDFGTDADRLDGQFARFSALTDHLTDVFSMTDAQATATLHHSVLPRLEDMGLLDYDHDDNTVTINSAEGVAAILRALEAVEHAFDGHDPVAPDGWRDAA